MRQISRKNKQLLMAGLLGGGALGIIGLLVWSIGDHASLPTPTTLLETRIETAGNRINPQEVWVERLEGENKITQQKIDALEKLMIANAKSIGDAEEKTTRLEREIVDLQAGITPPTVQEKASDNPSFEPLEPTSSAFAGPATEEKGGGIKKIVLQLSSTGPGNSKKEHSTLENTLPAGTFARGILLGGVDASTATNEPNDPRPLLIRITDQGTLPRKFKSDLKDCHILASCYGDLSSECVYMRLEKLTCTERLTGEISETQVAGYVVGEDGKAGVRGIVVDRTGPVIRNSLLGGFFSGMGKFFESQPSGFALPVMPLGTQSPSSLQQMLVKGGTSGASSALEKYADFFIKRAEQLQPVLQVAAGRLIDIVFTQGTAFGETSVRKSLKKIRDRSRKKALETLETTENHSWLPESPTNPGDES